MDRKENETNFNKSMVDLKSLLELANFQPVIHRYKRFHIYTNFVKFYWVATSIPLAKNS